MDVLLLSNLAGFASTNLPAIKLKEIGGANLYFYPEGRRLQLLAGLSRLQTGDVAPQGRYSETVDFARRAPQLANFLEKK